MISLRGHYTIDLVAGIIFGHYMHIMARMIAPFVDNVIWSLPKLLFSSDNDEVEMASEHYNPKSYDLESGMMSNDNPGAVKI